MTGTYTPHTIDRTDPEGEIAKSAARNRNWGRWGEDDVRGTMNYLTDDLRSAAGSLIVKGVSFSLSQSFDMDGPQKGWRRRTNPVHTMLDTGTDAAAGIQGFPHGLGGADDVVSMPLQCSTQWDGLGHIFDHGVAWNGRPAGSVVTSLGDRVTGIETVANGIVGRGVLLDVGRRFGERGELPDGFAITTDHLVATIEAQGPTSEVRRGDLVLIRTGQLSRVVVKAGEITPAEQRPDCRSPPQIGCTTVRSLLLPPIPGDSRCGRMSSTSRSSPCIRWRFRTSACSSARCGISMGWPRTALRMARTSSSSPPLRYR